MRLLIITSQPDRATFRQRIGVHIPLLEAHGVHCEIARLPAGAGDRSRLFRRTSAFDLVFLHRKTLNLWDAFWLRRHCPGLIYDFDDAIMYNDRRPQRVDRGRRRRFRRTATLSNEIIAGNNYLAAHARQYNSSVHILPTGLDLGPYSVGRPPRSDAKRRLVWIGSRNTLKYLAGLRDALEEIGRKHRDVVLRIVADAFLDLKHMEVERIAWSLQTEAQSLLASDIGLAPLPDDAFSRGKCGFKVLQYQAAGLPVVASPVGVNAEYVRDGVSGLQATRVEEWVHAIDLLLGDAARRASMGQCGRNDVVEFGLEPIGERLCAILCGCRDGTRGTCDTNRDCVG